ARLTRAELVASCPSDLGPRQHGARRALTFQRAAPRFRKAAPRFPKGCPPRGRPWETRGQPRRLDKSGAGKRFGASASRARGRRTGIRGAGSERRRSAGEKKEKKDRRDRATAGNGRR